MPQSWGLGLQSQPLPSFWEAVLCSETLRMGTGLAVFAVVPGCWHIAGRLPQSPVWGRALVLETSRSHSDYLCGGSLFFLP